MSSLLIPPPEDPVRAAAQWVGEAEALGRRNANAMALASADAAGSPSVRMVLLKELAPLGYAVFYTNYDSRKGAELAATGRAAAVLYWHELGRQVRFEGRVVRSPATESDRYFASRAPASQVNAWSSEQSRPLADPAALEERAAKIAATSTAGQRPECAPITGADSDSGSKPSSCGSKGRTAFTSGCATSASSTREMPTVSTRAAGTGSGCNPSATASRRLIQFETITCPYCWESIEITLDLSVDEQQQVEDCSVCCRPILIRYRAEDGELAALDIAAENRE